MCRRGASEYEPLLGTMAVQGEHAKSTPMETALRSFCAFLNTKTAYASAPGDLRVDPIFCLSTRSDTHIYNARGKKPFSEGKSVFAI